MDRQVIDDLDLSGKRVLTRVDFNVPISDGKVVDDTRIQAALPTIKKIIADKGKLVLMSHLGRPQGETKEEFSLKPVGERLSGLIGQDVKMASDCVGESVENSLSG